MNSSDTQKPEAKLVEIPVEWLERLIELANKYDETIEKIDDVNDTYELWQRIPWSQLKGYIESAESIVERARK